MISAKLSHKKTEVLVAPPSTGIQKHIDAFKVTTYLNFNPFRCFGVGGMCLHRTPKMIRIWRYNIIGAYKDCGGWEQPIRGWL